MRLITAYGGGGSGYYPYTQKPVDYQPYRPVYLFRGPPPDAGFSYGLYEDEDTGKKYYAELGLDTFSPLSGRSSKLLEELTPRQIEQKLGDDLKQDHLQERSCQNCASKYYDNFHLTLKGRDDIFCHRCGSKFRVEKKKPEQQEQEATSAPSLVQDPNVVNFVKKSLDLLLKSSQMKELGARLANRYGLTPEQARTQVLLALKGAIH
jgi:hypothetical protein